MLELHIPYFSWSIYHSNKGFFTLSKSKLTVGKSHGNWERRGGKIDKMDPFIYKHYWATFKQIDNKSHNVKRGSDSQLEDKYPNMRNYTNTTRNLDNTPGEFPKLQGWDQEKGNLTYQTISSHQWEQRDKTHRQPSRPGSLVAARWAFVLLNMLRSCWGDLHTLAVEPLLTDIAANPKFIGCIVLSTSPT